MPKVVELRQQRSLICNNFDGYKLSLDAVPDISLPNPNGVHKAEPTSAQYSYLHAELFSTQNLLQIDPWIRTDAYFITQKGEIMKSSYNEQNSKPKPLKVVFKLLPSEDIRIPGDYNYSMRFISENKCLLCDGINNLYLFETGNRLMDLDWQLLTQTKLEFKVKDELISRNFIIFDARLDTINNQEQIIFALGHIHRHENSNSETSHFTQIHCAKWLNCKDTIWEFIVLDTLESKGSVYYCAIEPLGEFLTLSSNYDFKFCSIVEEEKTLEDLGKPQLNNGVELNGFTWSQSDDDVVIKFDAKPNCCKTDYKIKCTTNNLDVKYKDQQLLQHELYAEIDQDLVTWSIENDYLQITLIKHQSPFNWPNLLSSGEGPKENIEETRGDRAIHNEQQPIPNLEAPIEDCDFPMGYNDDIKIERFHISTKTITHSVLLGTNPPLFSTILQPGFPNAIATRQDVDACLWLQKINPNQPNEWGLRHEGSLHAFGYVQASKQQKKFMDCAPDLSYAVICEANRHIFLYKCNYDSSSGLKNRNGPNVKIGKQQLITLKDNVEIIGIATANCVITILTPINVLYLQIMS